MSTKVNVDLSKHQVQTSSENIQVNRW